MRLLVDSDFLVGLFRMGDVHHEEVKRHFKDMAVKNANLLITNLVRQETATVLSHRVDMKAVRLFHKKFPELGMILINVDQEIENKAWEILLKQTKEGCSFVDCANLAVVEEHRLDGVMSFDKFYPEKLRSVWDI